MNNCVYVLLNCCGDLVWSLDFSEFDNDANSFSFDADIFSKSAVEDSSVLTISLTEFIKAIPLDSCLSWKEICFFPSSNASSPYRSLRSSYSVSNSGLLKGFIWKDCKKKVSEMIYDFNANIQDWHLSDNEK